MLYFLFIIFELCCVLILSYFSIMFFIGGIRMMCTDKNSYTKLHKINNNLLKTLKGKGIAFDLKLKKYIKL